jgi:hypothetical protein
MNAVSSRSHSIFSLYLTGANAELGAVVSGCLHLCDLAGSATPSAPTHTRTIHQTTTIVVLILFIQPFRALSSLSFCIPPIFLKKWLSLWL